MISTFRIASPLLALTLAACGGSSSTTTSTEQDANGSVTTEQGLFLDSAVQGLSYSTDTLTGITDTNGTFDYVEGENIVFSIGDLVFPSISASSVITPVDYAAGKENPESFTLNMARLLQSLDVDGNPDNGITIPSTAQAVSSDISFDISSDEFAANPSVINLVANSGSVTTSLVDASSATNHLLATIASLQSTSANSLDEVTGYWTDPTNGDYTQISDTGVIAFYDNQTAAACYTVRLGTIERVESTLYQLDTEDGLSQQLVITRTGDTLNILLLGSLNLVTDSSPSDLQICPE